jgi:hypothetical protein
MLVGDFDGELVTGLTRLPRGLLRPGDSFARRPEWLDILDVEDR